MFLTSLASSTVAMYGLEYGVCKECQRSTPISVNTLTESGLRCVRCLLAGQAKGDRIRPIDARIASLEQELQELYVTKAWFSGGR